MSKIVREPGSIRNLNFRPIEHEPEPDATGDDSEATGSPGAGAATLASAHEAAREIIEDAEARAREIEAEAYRRGHRDGLEAARLEMAEAVATIQLIAQHALEEKWKVVQAAERDIAALAVEIAEKIISKQISLDPQVVVSVAKKALMLTVEREHIQIRVNPEDMEAIKESKGELAASMDGIQKIEIIADRRVQRGGCVLETVAGNVDAQIQSQLSEAHKALRGVVSVD